MVYPKTTMAHRISSEVQSVTSNSKSSEEESSHGGGEADSSDDDARRADASVLQRRTLDEAMTRAVESESEAAASSTSREPQPVQGGSDEVVRLSHVASIEVRQDVSMDPPRSSASDVHRKSNSNGRTMSPVPEAMERSGSGGSRDGKARFLGPVSGAAHNRAGSASAEDAAAEDDSVATSDCAPMDLIDKSPYEPSLNAEKGIKVFTDMKNLLAESHDDNLRSVDPKAAKIFGPTNAWCLVKANCKCAVQLTLNFPRCKTYF